MNPETKQLLLARLHLEGVLGVLPEFFRFAPEAKELLPIHPFGLRLSTSEGVSQVIRFTPQGVTVSEEGSGLPTLTLFFLSNSQLNRLFLQDGLSIPLPLGNPLLFPKLITFKKCMDRLEKRLKSTLLPRDTQQDPLDLWLQFLVALHGLEAVGTLDPKVIHCLKRCPAGIAEFSVAGTDFIASVEWDGQHIRTCEGKVARPPDVRLRFTSPDILEQALRTELDQMASVSLGLIQIEGLIPLAEALGIVSDRISHYLKPQ